MVTIIRAATTITSPPTGTPQIKVPLVSDGFSGPNGTELVNRKMDAALGGGSLTWQGTTGALMVQDGFLVQGASTAAATNYVTPPSANYEVRLTVASPSTNVAGYVIDVRRTTSTPGGTYNTYRVNIGFTSTGGTFKLDKRIASTQTNLIPAVTFATGDSFGVALSGSSFTLVKNGVAQGTATDTEIAATGFLALGSAANLAGMKLDNFMILPV